MELLDAHRHRYGGAEGAGLQTAREGRRHGQAGAPLIEFDLDFLATHAKSLLTQIVITNSERVTSLERASGLGRGGKGRAVHGHGGRRGRAAAPTGGATTVTSDAILIPNPTGLHARPAAVVASLAKGFSPTIKLQLGDRQANARSVTAIMALDVGHGAKVQVVASGPDAKAAVEKLSAVLAAGLGDEGCKPAPAPATTHRRVAAAGAAAARKSSDPNLLIGVSASPGLAVGEVFQVRREEIAVTEAGAGVDSRTPTARRCPRHRARPARCAARAASRQARGREGRDLRRARRTADRSGSAGDGRVGDRQGQERRVRVEEARLRLMPISSPRMQQSTAGPTRERRA